MPMHSEMFRLDERVGHFHLILHGLVRLTLLHHIAAELAGQQDDGAVQKSTRFEVANELGNGGIDLLLHSDRALMTVLVRIPILERNVFRGYLDESRSRFSKTARQQTPQTERPGVVNVITGLRFERKIESFSRRRIKQTVRRIHRSPEGIALIFASKLLDRTLSRELAEQLVSARKPRLAQFSRSTYAGSGIQRIRY